MKKNSRSSASPNTPFAPRQGDHERDTRLKSVLRTALQEAMGMGVGLSLGVGVAACSIPFQGDNTPVGQPGGAGGSSGSGGGAGGSLGAGGASGAGGNTISPFCASLAGSLGCDSEQNVLDFAKFTVDRPVDEWLVGAWRDIYSQNGQLCANTERPAECKTAVAEALAATNPPAPSCDDICPTPRRFIAARRGNDITVLSSSEQLARFLAPIENAAEATAVATFFAGLQFDCAKDPRMGVWCEGDSFSIVARTFECQSEESVLKVKVPRDGTAPTTEAIDTIKTTCVIGRVPDGCSPEIQHHRWGTLADFLSECAGLEAASVPAFLLLAEDLRALGAPETLVDAALKSARDEIRHAGLMMSLAVRAGAGSQVIDVASRERKTLFEMARENAVEGCVRETYGALVGAYQAQMAQDPTIRGALEHIADDEMQHALLSHAIAAWAEPLLTDGERAIIAEERQAMMRQMREAAMEDHASDIYEQAGYPAAPVALRMLAALEANLWA